MTPIRLLLATLILLAAARAADAGARRSRPVKTGQTLCYDASDMVTSCVGTGQDGDLRRGEARSYQDNGDGTIRDKRTALTWEKLSDDGSIHDQDNTYTWGLAFGKIEDLNIECFAGFCDWRLPNLFELQTLLNLENANPAVSAPFHTDCSSGCSLPACSCTRNLDYWSSTTLKDNPALAWVVDFQVGFHSAASKPGSYAVRAVRGGAN